MKLKNVFLTAIAVLVLSCSSEDSTSTTNKEILKRENALRNANQNIHDYTKLLKDLYGANNFKALSVVSTTQDNEKFEIIKVVNKHSNSTVYGYFLKTLSTNKLYYLAHNSTTGIVDVYSTEKFEIYDVKTYDLKNDSYYFVAGFNPSNARTIETKLL